MADTGTTTYQVPSGGWNPNSLEDYFKSQGMQWDSKNIGSVFEKQGLGTASTYTGTGPQNMALLAKLKGYSGTNSKGIGGGAGVGLGRNQTDATTSALNSIIPTALVTDTTSNTHIPTESKPLTAPPPLDQPSQDPNIATYQSTANADIATTQAQTQSQLQPITDEHLQTITQLQKDKATAIASAEAEYSRANPYGSGSGKDEFLKSIGDSYDTQLANANTNYGDQVLQANTASNAQIQNIKDNYKSQVMSWNQQVIATQKAAKSSVLQMLAYGAIDPSNPPQWTIDSLVQDAGMTQDEATSFLGESSYKSQAASIALQKLGISEEQVGIAAKRLGVSEGALNLATEKWVDGTSTTTDNSLLEKAGFIPASTVTKVPGTGGGTSGGGSTDTSGGSSDYQNYLNSIGQ